MAIDRPRDNAGCATSRQPCGIRDARNVAILARRRKSAIRVRAETGYRGLCKGRATRRIMTPGSRWGISELEPCSSRLSSRLAARAKFEASLTHCNSEALSRHYSVFPVNIRHVLCSHFTLTYSASCYLARLSPLNFQILVREHPSLIKRMISLKV